MSVTCDLCGLRAEEAETLSWTTTTDRQGVQRCCDACSRRHLRAIEAGLDAEHW